MTRLCLDLNVWCSAYLARRLGRRGTASQTLVDAVRLGRSDQGPLTLVISWGMLDELRRVLVESLDASGVEAAELAELIAGFARPRPSLTLGGVGVMPIRDVEDRHVLETAWAGDAEILVTANMADFVQPRDEAIISGRLYRLRRGPQTMLLAHPFEAASWLREGKWRGVSS